MTDKEYVEYIWHFKVDDNLDWRFCAGFLEQNDQGKISPKKLENKFKRYFEKTVGIAPYTRCPRCNKELLPRESAYGYFVGCAAYPECKFIATNTKPYNSDKDKKINN